MRSAIIKRDGMHNPVANEPEDISLWGILIHKTSEAEKEMWEYTKKMRRKYTYYD